MLFSKPHLNHPRQHWVTQASLKHKQQCWYVCLFSIEILTAGRIGMKFGMEVVLEGEGSEGGGVDLVPQPPRYRVCKGGMVCLWRLSSAFWQKL